ncbi:MAG: hypothetical protein ACHREM_02180 [Polyangiales bacterium]
MRSYDPNDQDDVRDMKKLAPSAWMLEALELNPAYVHWGPGDDYMLNGDACHGWARAVEYASWKDHEITLDELNEVVHFYFEVARDADECARCGGNGEAPEAKALRTKLWGPKGRRSHVSELVASELRVLIAEKRLSLSTDLPDADLVAAAKRLASPFEGIIDAINDGILLEARCKEAGIAFMCPKCDGDGSFYTTSPARLRLVYWLLHPRKGASGGVTVDHVQKSDLPAVYAFLTEAARRNAERFAKVVAKGA